MGSADGGGYVGGGIAEDVSARLSVWASGRDGYEKNLSGPEVNNIDQYGFRGRVKWQPTDRLKANFIAYYSHIDSACCTADTLDPTGVGDAFRGGLLKGLAAGADWETCGRLGSVAATFALECVGGQSHAFTQDEFRRRYEVNFGPMPI